MSGLKDWGVPLLAAAVTFAGLSVVDLRGGGAGHADDDGFTHPFPRPRVGDANDTATVVLLSRDPMPVGAQGTTEWRTPHVALQRSSPFTALCVTSFPCVVTHEVAAADEPRLLRGGHNATRVTVHAFDAAGELVFSNGDAAEQERLVRGLTPEQLPRGTWYLGANPTPPNGTQRLPPAAAAFLGQARPMLEGLPVGGVVTVETEALRTWYGMLFVTMRVDALVHAP